MAACTAPKYLVLARAGWSMVQVDWLGDLQSAAFGLVPIRECPAQTSRDGEDCALSMLTYVAVCNCVQLCNVMLLCLLMSAAGSRWPYLYLTDTAYMLLFVAACSCMLPHAHGSVVAQS